VSVDIHKQPEQANCAVEENNLKHADNGFVKSTSKQSSISIKPEIKQLLDDEVLRQLDRPMNEKSRLYPPSQSQHPQGGEVSHSGYHDEILAGIGSWTGKDRTSHRGCLAHGTKREVSR
jgi:hypothetical protein